MRAITFYPLEGLPEVRCGDDLAELLLRALSPLCPVPGDILVVTHKIVSKAEGAVRTLEEIRPTTQAEAIAVRTEKDPRQVQAILDCSSHVWACERGIVMAERPDGWVCANAGVDASNAGGDGRLVLLPDDCDAIARRLGLALAEHLGMELPVIICDTHGRALRNGAVGVCVGCYGLETMRRYRGSADRDGRMLMHTSEAVADEVAAGATLVMGQGSEGVPAVLVRGCGLAFAKSGSEDLKRSEEQRLYTIKPECCKMSI
ncbi:MAG: coenzyme F420-0:L-glutamate ligase [Clostridiales bacterium]|nr:coenzyme F420-0:L-glutamate ligase [Clostridiales bacterium]